MLLPRGRQPVARLRVAFERDERLRSPYPRVGVGGVEIDCAAPVWNRSAQLAKVPEHLSLSDFDVGATRIQLGRRRKVCERVAEPLLLREQHGEVETCLDMIG